jgi:hypothetical protein
MSKIPNEELVRKAVITAVDALASSGKLSPKQADRFLDYVIGETVLKDNARVVRFRNESMDIDKIGIGRRAAMPKSEARDPGHRRGISTSKISLTPKEIMVPVEISDIFAEINIEGESVKDHIMRMFGTQLGNDLEELYILGNPLGPSIAEGDYIDGGSATDHVKDAYLALVSGWQLLADSGHIVDAQGANIGLSIFSQAIRAMPTKFRRNRKNLRWFMSPDLAQIYMEKLSTRATKVGDDAAEGKGVAPFGIPIVEVPLWQFQPQEVEHIDLPGTTAVSLKNAPVSNVVVTPETLGETPTTPWVEGTDYNEDLTAGTVARDAGGSIGDGDTVKVTYDANPQIILTHMNNFIVGIGRDIRIEKDRDIYKGVDQYAITIKADVQMEETDAVVKVRNIGTGV